MYHFRLQRTDGSQADPPTYRSTVLNWRQGDTIPLGRDRKLRVIGTRLEEGTDGEPRLRARGRSRLTRRRASQLLAIS
jgi:hypothetical protein